MWSIIAASVVDLPEPVVPVRRIRPRSSSAISSITGGSISSSAVLISNGIARQTSETDAALHERVHAEAGHAGNRVGEVDLALVAERLELRLVREHVEEGGLGVLGPERLHARDRHELAVLADDGRGGDLEMEVGGLRLDDGHEGSVDVEHSSSIDIRTPS